MSAALHCIVREIEDFRIREQLRAWRGKTEADPLIQKIRVLKNRDVLWSLKSQKDEDCIEHYMHLGWKLAEAGAALRRPTSVIPEEIIPHEDLEHWDESYFAFCSDALKARGIEC